MCEYGKNPCGHFNYVRVGVANTGRNEGNNAENMFAETVSVQMDRESRKTAAKVKAESENAWMSFIIKKVFPERKFVNLWILVAYE